MNRREKARQKKRKDRERRLRAERHAVHFQPAGVDALPPEADILEDPDAEPADDEAPTAAPEDDAGLSRLLAPFEDERRQRRVARALDAQTFSDDAARERAAAELAGKTPEALDDAFGPDPVEAAHDLALLAFEAENMDIGERHFRLALELNPECTDARMLAAVANLGGNRLVAELTRVVDDAARALGGELFLARAKGSAWSQVRALPYLRARYELMEALIDVGRTQDAIAHGDALLDLDPEDHEHVRNHLCGLLLEHGDLPRARALLERFEAQTSPYLVWGYVLERFLAGDRREAARLRTLAVRVLPQVEELILGRERPAEADDPEASVIDLLASEAYAPLARAWARHKQARRWLADGALASTAAERRAVAESYRPPVVALLRLGQPTFGGPGEDLRAWPDLAARLGLTAADVPELLRMAADPALHEQDGKSAAVWAPVHAWRTLALMAMRGVPGAADVATLIHIRLVRERQDDWTSEDAVNVLGLIGEPALQATAELALDRSFDEEARAVAVEALAVMGERYPVLAERVTEVLLRVIRDVLDDVEQAVAEGLEAEQAAEGMEAEVIGFAVNALLRVRAGKGPRAGDVQAIVRRAFEVGVVEEQVSGTRDQVLAEMRGEAPPRSDGEDAFEAT